MAPQKLLVGRPNHRQTILSSYYCFRMVLRSMYFKISMDKCWYQQRFRQTHGFWRATHYCVTLAFYKLSSSPSELVRESFHSLGYTVFGNRAISVPSHGAMEFYKECEGLGIQAILGSQLQLENNEQCVLLCENLAGLRKAL